MADLTGDWNSYYRYPSSGRGEDFWGRHLFHARQDGNKLTLETGPESPSYQIVELEVAADGNSATGVWTEDTAPDGYYKGRRFEGTVEFKITHGNDRMSGIWHGAGRDGTVHSDIWELVRVKAPQTRHTDKRPRRWRLNQWHPTTDDTGEELYSSFMAGYWTDDALVLETESRDDGTYMLIRLLIQNGIARGSWQVTSSPTGDYEGAEYTGEGELVVDPKTLNMEGMWLGAGLDRAHKKTRIYTGRWEIKPVNEK
jgi:hypothetical protein